MAKWMKRLGLGLAALVGIGAAAVASVVVSTSRNPGRAIGAQQVLAPDAGHGSIPVTIFYPTSDEPGWNWLGIAAVKVAPNGAIDGRRLPLVVMSHGTGGSPLTHIDTALALAAAGYVVAAPMHPGDNFQDESNVGTDAWMVDRARQLVRVDDFMLGQWEGRSSLDPERVGLFGYSAGGTAALIAIGGQPDLAHARSHCAAKPEFVCQILKPAGQAEAPAPAQWARDERVRAAALVAPGLGFAFEPAGLSAVNVPVQLWAGAADENVPLATNAATVERLLPTPPQFHQVERAAHFSFLPPCGLMAPLFPERLCTDPPGFDREAFHRQFEQALVAFFDKELAAR